MTRTSDNIQQVMPPEIALLVACARTRLSEDDKTLIRSLLNKNLNWHTVFTNAFYHKVIPLLHRSLTNNFKDLIPAKPLAELKNSMKLSTIHTMNISASLIRVVNLLEQNNIKVLPVKGPLLAEKLYGSANMRGFSDVDILVNRNDLTNSLNLLRQNGYQMLPDGIPQSTFLKFLKYYHHGQLLDKTGTLIELHWELSGFYAPKPMTMDTLEPYLTTTMFNGHCFTALTDEMLFLFLCLHGSKHRWEKLDYLSSVADLVNICPFMNWQTIMEVSKKLKMKKRVLLALNLASSILGSAVPTDLLIKTNSDPEINNLKKTIIKNELTPKTDNLLMRPTKKQLLYQSQIMDDKLDAIRFILRWFLVPSHDAWPTMRVPDILYPLYFLRKPYRELTMIFCGKKNR